MKRFNELLDKRRNLTANIFEEEELINISKSLSEEQLKDIDKELLTYSNGQRLREISRLFDDLLNELNKHK